LWFYLLYLNPFFIRKKKKIEVVKMKNEKHQQSKKKVNRKETLIKENGR